VNASTLVLTWCIRVLWILVIAGLLGLLLGAFEANDPVQGAVISPEGDVLCMWSVSGAARSYALPDLSHPLATGSIDVASWEPLSWADARRLVLQRDGQELVVLDLETLELRGWCDPGARDVLLGLDGRTLVAVAVREPQEPLWTFDLASGQTARRDPPGADAAGMPFQHSLPPVGTGPAGVEVDVRDGRLELRHPALQPGGQQLWWTKPRLWLFGLLFGLAALLVILRTTRVLIRRRQRFDDAIRGGIASDPGRREGR
jgi:hypothetical protein